MKRTLIAVAAAVSLILTPVALAHHKEDHTNGPTYENQSDTRGNAAGASDKHGDSGVGTTASTSVPDDTDDNAHPSGNDKETNNGPTDDTQGNTQSDPDDDGRGPDRSNGGRDFPGFGGGVDKNDQDRNNGCGNDDDFEDDNEGWCGGKPKQSKPTPRPTPTTTVSPSPGPTSGGTPTPSASPTASPGGGSTPTPSPTSGGGSGASPTPKPTAAESPTQTVEPSTQSNPGRDRVAREGIRLPFTGVAADLLFVVSLLILTLGLIAYIIGRK